jgi:catechol 2,3-dioxygenase-like lactoylglutathione lyase family enzyme
MPQRIHHVDLPMKDFDASDRFYSKSLGWPVRRAGVTPHGWRSFAGKPPAGFEPRVLEVRMQDGSYLAFILGKTPDYSRDEPHLALKLSSTERQALLRRLKAGGIAVERNPRENFAVYDPSGLRLEFY